MRDVSKTGRDPKNPHIQYSVAQMNTAKFMYEVEGKGLADISDVCGIHRNIIGRWRKKYKWVQGRHIEIVEKTALAARLEKAEQIGIGEIAQMKKAKELMDAEQEIRLNVPKADENGQLKMVEVTVRQPDYKIQNEGLKRAMELTGTKIERKEIEHKGSQEIIHRYELPAKIPI